MTIRKFLLRLLPFAGALAVAALFSSCASAGNNINESRVTEIRRGSTTESDLIRMFGPPNQRSISGNGESVLTWTYIQANVTPASFIPYAGAFMGGTQSANKSLTVFLRGNRVTNYTYSGGDMEARQNRFGKPGGA